MAPFDRPDDRVWRKWYSTARWKRLRDAVLTDQPLCVRCLATDIVTEATVVHHKVAHRGDPALFFDQENLEPLCKPHHDSHGQLEDHGRRVILFGPDGWPL